MMRDSLLKIPRRRNDAFVRLLSLNIFSISTNLLLVTREKFTYITLCKGMSVRMNSGSSSENTSIRAVLATEKNGDKVAAVD